jgi:uridine phosphorylase
MEAARASTKSKEVKEVVLVPGDRSKIARIGANLDSK